jgi:hypothetical protein
MDKIATLALRNFPKSLTPPFFAPRYSRSKNSAVRLGLKKHGYGILKNPPPKKTQHYSNKHLSQPVRRPCRTGEQGFLALPQHTQKGIKTAAKPPVFWHKKQTNKPCFFRPAIFGYKKRQTGNGTKNPGNPPL